MQHPQSKQVQKRSQANEDALWRRADGTMAPAHLRDPKIEALIRGKSATYARNMRYAGVEVKDTRQSLWLLLTKRESQFDPERSSFPTFAEMAVDNEIISMARYDTAAKRNRAREEMSLNQTVTSGNGDGEDGQFEASQTIADPNVPAPDVNDLQHDLDAVTSMLTPRQQRILKLVPRRMAKARLAKAVGATLDELEQELAAIKDCFTEHNLHLYLR
ncbi:hypothetical protein ACERK3_07110 [Phycisphaerales bacterium AB-hyl4]|uniref:Uncharacterized protein n=1 Tax=Natronomicrosphaera hydrolytica TaxID=3242702 RepID=A0ABV4U5I0_9BACT